MREKRKLARLLFASILLSGSSVVMAQTDKPVTVRLKQASIRELFVEIKKQVQVKGCAKIKTVIPCDRCLEDVEQIFDLDFEREVDLKLDEEGRRQSDDEYNFMEGNCLDTDVLICNELLVNWPIRVLCREDCKGLCSICGANLNHGECGCDREVLDPRMAAFQDIFSKFKEV